MSDEARKQLIRVGLLAVIIVLLVGSVIWNMRVRATQNLGQGKTQSAADFMVTWRCLGPGCDATEDAPGAPGPRTCPKCGKQEFYSTVRFTGDSGTYVVYFNYDPKTFRPTQVKVADGPWVPYVDAASGKFGIVDPKSGRIMNPAEGVRPAKQGDPQPEPPPDDQQP